jgi:hypothetical protein
MEAIFTQCAKHFEPAVKTYRVTIKQPKGRAEFSVTVKAVSKEHAIQDGIWMAEACGEVVNPFAVTVREVNDDY